MGFTPYAYRGLETGSREMVTHVIKNGRVLIALSSPLKNDSEFHKQHSEHFSKHGDGVKDIAFEVENCEQTFKIAVSRGAKVVREPETQEDDNGYVVLASVSTYGETTHTFVERTNFKGFFLPNFVPLKQDPINEVIEVPQLGFIDHIVGNHPLGDMEPTVQWYEKMLDFHRFWSVDDSIIHTEYR
jgi:4-hydroxyphenylpyruvate dioxygenase